MACKSCGGNEILIHRSFVGEELCYSCLEALVKVQDEAAKKKQLEIVPSQALNPRSREQLNIMGE